MQVEQRLDPSLRDAPVIVSGLAWKADVVLDASMQAIGAVPGMSVRQAQQVCPFARVISPREELYFVQHDIIEKKEAVRTRHQLLLHVLPDQARREAVSRQVAVDRIMAEPLRMIGEVRQRVVDLTAQQILAVIQTGHLLLPSLCHTGIMLRVYGDFV
ncbi:MAG: hypothetical protein M1546_09225 [Chloroflexi bacterium]|nr:hypothetical protein [Chloroflexota bacterium]